MGGTHRQPDLAMEAYVDMETAQQPIGNILAILTTERI